MKVISLKCDSCGGVGYDTQGCRDVKAIRRNAAKMGWRHIPPETDVCQQCAQAQEARDETDV
jgi:hypothetical protein